MTPLLKCSEIRQPASYPHEFLLFQEISRTHRKDPAWPEVSNSSIATYLVRSVGQVPFNFWWNFSLRSVHNVPTAPKFLSKHPLRYQKRRKIFQAARDESTTLLGTHGGGTEKKSSEHPTRKITLFRYFFRRLFWIWPLWFVANFLPIETMFFFVKKTHDSRLKWRNVSHG